MVISNASHYLVTIAASELLRSWSAQGIGLLLLADTTTRATIGDSDAECIHTSTDLVFL